MTGPFSFPGAPQPNAFERRGLIERQRGAAMLATARDGPAARSDGTEEIRLSQLSKPYTFEARNDPAAGVRWVAQTFGATTLTAVLPDGGGIGFRWFDGQDEAGAVAWVAEKNAAGFNTYFNPQLARAGLAKKPTNADIVTLRAAAWADLDAKEGRDLPALLLALQGLPAPDLIIASGGGIQPLWMLATPLSGTTENVAQLQRINKRIACHVAGDAVHDVSRILRLPFTLNHPNAKKRAAGRVVTPSGLIREGGAA